MTSVYCLHSILKAVWGLVCLVPHFLVCSSFLSIILHCVRVEFQDEQTFRTISRNDLILSFHILTSGTLTWPQGGEVYMGQSSWHGSEFLNILKEEERLLLLTTLTFKMLQSSDITSESSLFIPWSTSFSYHFLVMHQQVRKPLNAHLDLVLEIENGYSDCSFKRATCPKCHVSTHVVFCRTMLCSSELYW